MCEGRPSEHPVWGLAWNVAAPPSRRSWRRLCLSTVEGGDQKPVKRRLHTPTTSEDLHQSDSARAHGGFERGVGQSAFDDRGQPKATVSDVFEKVFVWPSQMHRVRKKRRFQLSEKAQSCSSGTMS